MTLQYLMSGLEISMLLFLVSSGMTLIFGLMGIVNLAHGSLFMVGAYLTLTLFRLGVNFWFTLLLAPLGVAFVSVIIERFLIRPLYNRDPIYQLLLTFGLILIIEDLTRTIWGSGLQYVPHPALIEGTMPIFGQSIPKATVFIIVSGLFAAVVLWVFVHKTKLGLLVRAASSNKIMTSTLGVNVSFLYTLVFALGSVLAGFGGAIATQKMTFSPSMALIYLIDSFVVVILGGLGSLKGALVGSLIIGAINVSCTLLFPQFTVGTIYLVLCVFLIIKPRGLFGEDLSASSEHGVIIVAELNGENGNSASANGKNVFSSVMGKYSWILLIASACILAVMPLIFRSWTVVNFVTEIMIMSLFATGVGYLFGYVGLMPFGHAAFFAVGGYTAALMLKEMSAPFLLSLIGAALTCGIVGAVMGYFCLRQRGTYFSLLSLGFGQLIFTLLHRTRGITGGADGYSNIPFPAITLLGIKINLSDPIIYYYFSLLVMIGALLVLAMILRSPFGEILQAIRENRERVMFIGLNPDKFVLIAFIISGIYVGMSGALLTPFIGIVTPQFADWGTGAGPVLMGILAGTQTVMGPALGAFILLPLQKVLVLSTEHWQLFLGGILVFTVIEVPGGILSLMKTSVRRLEKSLYKR